MNSRILALAALAMLTANAAQAAVYFDSISPPASYSGNADGPSDGSTVLAQSFTVAGTPDFNSVTLALNADTPGDLGSVMVFLVPDDSSGGVSGSPGNPLLSADSTTFSPASFLGTINDSGLAATGNTPTLVTLSISPSAVASVSGNSANQEYWIGLVASNASSAEWAVAADDQGTGVAGQAYFNNFGNANGSSTIDAQGSNGAYQMIVSSDGPSAAPEPASLAILGGGLAGLGYVRRRRANKA